MFRIYFGWLGLLENRRGIYDKSQFYIWSFDFTVLVWSWLLLPKMKKKTEIRQDSRRSQDISFPEAQRTHIAQREISKNLIVDEFFLSIQTVDHFRPLPFNSFGGRNDVYELSMLKTSSSSSKENPRDRKGEKEQATHRFNLFPKRSQFALHSTVHNNSSSSHLEEEDNTIVKLEHSRSLCLLNFDIH